MAGKAFHFNGIQAILTDIGVDIEQANMIASASQAVDDFTDEQLIVFDDGKLYNPVVTAHKSLDPDNLDSRDASNVWMPFHFFPDHDGVCRPETDNVRKLVNYVKKKIADERVLETEKNLYIGILLHILVDTYTHQDFMGLHCRHNDISRLDDEDEWNLTLLPNALPAIGHGEALTYPDDMWRRWSYKDSRDEERRRDNQDIFYQIIGKIPEFLNELGIGNGRMDEEKKQRYKPIFNSQEDHEEKFNEITEGNVPPGSKITYKHWKNKALRAVQSKDNVYIKKDPDNFKTSEWYLFQKVARDIRHFFTTEIFPELTIQTKVY